MKKTIKTGITVVLLGVITGCSNTATGYDPGLLTDSVPVSRESIEKLEAVYNKTPEQIESMFGFSKEELYEVCSIWRMKDTCICNGSDYVVFFETVDGQVIQLRYACQFEEQKEAIEAAKELYEEIVDEHGEPEVLPDKPATFENLFVKSVDEMLSETGNIDSAQYWFATDDSSIGLRLFSIEDSEDLVLWYTMTAK